MEPVLPNARPQHGRRCRSCLALGDPMDRKSIVPVAVSTSTRRRLIASELLACLIACRLVITPPDRAA